MNKKPEPGAPDNNMGEWTYLQGFENVCDHQRYLRKCLYFSEEETQVFKTPHTHQVVFCLKCFQVIDQERARIKVE